MLKQFFKYYLQAIEADSEEITEEVVVDLDLEAEDNGDTRILTNNCF